MAVPARTTTIEIDRETADALRLQATARGLSIDAYLRQLIGPEAGSTLGEGNGNGHPSPGEIDQWLDELAAGFPATASLPPDFSRADIYDDHD